MGSVESWSRLLKRFEICVPISPVLAGEIHLHLLQAGNQSIELPCCWVSCSMRSWRMGSRTACSFCSETPVP